jgi:hypothetical protein
VGQAVRQDRMKAGIAENDFERAFRGRIFAKNRLDLFPDGAEHGLYHYGSAAQMQS